MVLMLLSAHIKISIGLLYAGFYNFLWRQTYRWKQGPDTSWPESQASESGPKWGTVAAIHSSWFNWTELLWTELNRTVLLPLLTLHRPFPPPSPPHPTVECSGVFSLHPSWCLFSNGRGWVNEGSPAAWRSADFGIPHEICWCCRGGISDWPGVWQWQTDRQTDQQTNRQLDF